MDLAAKTAQALAPALDRLDRRQVLLVWHADEQPVPRVDVRVDHPRLARAVRAMIQPVIGLAQLEVHSPNDAPSLAWLPVGTPLRAAATERSERVTTAASWMKRGAGVLVRVVSDVGLTLSGDVHASSADEAAEWSVVQLPDGYLGNAPQSKLRDAGFGGIDLTNVSSEDREKRSQWADDMLSAGLRMRGTKYVWGGTEPAEGLDCSGLVQRLFAESNAALLPRDAWQQARCGYPVWTTSRGEGLRLGDLMFFLNDKGRPYHVAMYLTGHKYLHAAGGAGVTVNSIDPGASDYDVEHGPDFWCARRLRR